jgi:hypothetical protein
MLGLGPGIAAWIFQPVCHTCASGSEPDKRREDQTGQVSDKIRGELGSAEAQRAAADGFTSA